MRSKTFKFILVCVLCVVIALGIVQLIKMF